MIYSVLDLGGKASCQFTPYTEAVQGNVMLASLGADLDSAAA